MVDEGSWNSEPEKQHLSLSLCKTEVYDKVLNIKKIMKAMVYLDFFFFQRTA